LNWSDSNSSIINYQRHLFDDELDLAYAVIDGVEARGERGNYTTKRPRLESDRHYQLEPVLQNFWQLKIGKIVK
jgi:putative transposase